jgi:cell division protein FtsW (lipid II flippase)
MQRRPMETEGTRPKPNNGRRERHLLLLAGACLLSAAVQLALVAGQGPNGLAHMAVWAGVAVMGHHVLGRWLPSRDPYLFPAVMLLSGLGILTITRLLPFFGDRQALWLVVGCGGLLLAARAPGNMRWLSQYRYIWLAFAVFLMILTAIIGRNPTTDFGPRLWIGVEGIYFQSGELLKLALAIFTASYLTDYKPMVQLVGLQTTQKMQPALAQSRLRYLAPLAIIWGGCILAMLWQRDLGAAAMLFIVFVLMMYAILGHTSILVGGAVIFVGAALLAYLSLPLVRIRVDAWRDPFYDPANRSFQMAQSLMAVAAGGVWGQGIGQPMCRWCIQISSWWPWLKNGAWRAAWRWYLYAP